MAPSTATTGDVYLRIVALNKRMAVKIVENVQIGG
jgi:hypothetical protein